MPRFVSVAYFYTVHVKCILSDIISYAQKVTRSYKKLRTKGYKRLQEVTRSYKKLQRKEKKIQREWSGLRRYDVNSV